MAFFSPLSTSHFSLYILCMDYRYLLGERGKPGAPCDDDIAHIMQQYLANHRVGGQGAHMAQQEDRTQISLTLTSSLAAFTTLMERRGNMIREMEAANKKLANLREPSEELKGGLNPTRTSEKRGPKGQVWKELELPPATADEIENFVMSLRENVKGLSRSMRVIREHINELVQSANPPAVTTWQT